ncbi:tumor necrosis factor receptor superfamily member 1A [Pseudorasbora parva]|uniref:tumor necrosis factor receptor superfamily member 1A n=1 Tax=Pseudorasbora parva TaxID=51549 RepID=UPI00351ED14D
MRTCQLCVYVLLILISQSHTISNSEISGPNTGKESCLVFQYWNKDGKGFCCDKCHPGSKLKQKCSENNPRSECETCMNGFYMDTSNYFPNCFSCEECKKPHSEEASACTIISNRVCKCEKGYYKRKLGDLDWECLPCRVCGSGQVQIMECTEEQNTKCVCREKHYLAENKNSCEPCFECREECEHLCSTPPMPTSPNTNRHPDKLEYVLVPVCAFITVVALAVFMLYESIRRWRKRNRALSSLPSSPAHEDQTLIIKVQPDTINENAPFTNQPCEPEQHRKLPDCVPREIKLHEFFYFVLDEVPIGRFKELVRRLGVSEQNIDRAEQDHRNCKDAHYQMLKVWSDSGSGGGNNVLPCHCIQRLIETLRDMYLVNCADNIENRFLTHKHFITRPSEENGEHGINRDLNLPLSFIGFP